MVKELAGRHLFPPWCPTACVVLDQSAAFCVSLLCILHADNYMLANVTLRLFVDLVSEGRRWQSAGGHYCIKKKELWRAISLLLVWVLHAVTTPWCITALLQHRQPVQPSTFLLPEVMQRCINSFCVFVSASCN